MNFFHLPLHRFACPVLMSAAIICCGCRDTGEPRADGPAFHSNPTDTASRTSSELQADQRISSNEASAAIQRCRDAKSPSLEIRSRVDDSALNEIASLEWLHALELYDVTTTPDQLTSATRRLSKLERLRVEGTPLNDAQIFAICRQHPDLKILNLPDAVFTDAGLAALAELSDLTLLRFGSPNVTDDGFVHLIGHARLRFLHLINVPISDAGLQHFFTMTQLESLYVDGGNATDQGILALLKANPGIHFHRNQLHIEDDPSADDH